MNHSFEESMIQYVSDNIPDTVPQTHMEAQTLKNQVSKNFFENFEICLTFENVEKKRSFVTTIR